jgi:hypothetical protein
MLWDTGWGMSAAPVAPKTSLVDLLAQVNVKPEQIKYVGISHPLSNTLPLRGSLTSNT